MKDFDQWRDWRRTWQAEGEQRRQFRKVDRTMFGDEHPVCGNELAVAGAERWLPW